jgi:hypothetical protein
VCPWQTHSNKHSGILQAFENNGQKSLKHCAHAINQFAELCCARNPSINSFSEMKFKKITLLSKKIRFAE